MRKIRLGRTEALVSAISLGTWSYGGSNMAGDTSVGWVGQEEKDSHAALQKAFELGINHWDTADVYGDGRSEAIIGSAWKNISRNNIFLASKVGWDSGTYDHFYHPDHMRNQIENSLINLKTDVIDLYYLHHCFFGKQEEYFDDANETIHRFKEEGKIRFIGLSDWDSDLIMQFIDRVDPDVIQPYRNVRDDYHAQSGLKSWVEKNDAGVCFFSPIKHGLLTGKYDKPVLFPEGDFRRGVDDFTDPKIIDQMKQNRLLLEERFSSHQNSVMHGLVDSLLTDSPSGCVLLGQRNASQVKAAATLGEPLTKEDAGWVSDLYRKN